MTAQGVLSSSAPAMKSMIPGLSVPEVSAKKGSSSFEDFMAAPKGERAQDTAETSREPKETIKSSDGVRERAKAMFSGESKVKEADTVPSEESVQDFEKMAETVASLMVQVRQVICEELGITEEQLTETMEELGLTDADLTDRSSLQDIFLKLNDASEPTEFLTNEELFGRFSELVENVEQTLNDAGVTPEECKTVLKETKLLQPDVNVELDAEPEEPEEPENILKKPEMLPQAKETKEVQSDVAEESVTAQPTVERTQVKAETGDAKEGQHTVSAREKGNAKIISSRNDADVKEMFIDTLTNATVQGTGEEALEAAAQVREIANQIMEQIRIVIRPEQTNMELQLNPEHLGRVNLTITEKEGIMTAQFTTQSEAAREAIESQMAALRESLQNQGIKVEAIEVTVSEFGFERDNNAGRNEDNESGKQKRRNAFRVEEADEAAPQTAEFMRMTDSSVDYSA